MIAIIVGGEDTVFHVHEDALCSQSGFFAADLSKEKAWKEGTEKRIRLPEHRSDIVKMYVQWLYSHKIKLRWTTAEGNLDGDMSLPEYYALTLLYIFGEKHCKIHFQDATLDEYVRRMRSHVDGGHYYPNGDVVGMIYTGTAQASPLRRLMVDAHLKFAYKEWFEDPVDEYHKEFLLDMVRAYATMNDEGTSFASLRGALNAEDYHVPVPESSGP